MVLIQALRETNYKLLESVQTNETVSKKVVADLEVGYLPTSFIHSFIPT